MLKGPYGGPFHQQRCVFSMYVCSKYVGHVYMLNIITLWHHGDTIGSRAESNARVQILAFRAWICPSSPQLLQKFKENRTMNPKRRPKTLQEPDPPPFSLISDPPSRYFHWFSMPPGAIFKYIGPSSTPPNQCSNPPSTLSKQYFARSNNPINTLVQAR